MVMTLDTGRILQLATEIRRVDGSNKCDATELAERLMPFIDAHLSAQATVQVTDGCKLGCSSYCKAEAHGCASECARLSQGAQGDGSYVHVVPDKCDRVVWHNQYIHLTERADVPDGWVMVPIDPTEDMLAQACTHDVQPRTEKVDQWNRDTWSFMLTAAPQPPEH